MATQGPNSAGTGANDAAFGSYSWTNPGNIVSSDDTYASTGTGHSSADSNYLKATNFGFSIPTGATIDGILVAVEKYVTNTTSGGAYDVRARIVKADGTIGTTDKSSPDAWPGTTDPGTYVNYGGATDKWGETWTVADINDADFGFVLAVQPQNASADARVDHIRITIYYTAGASGPTNLKSLDTNVKANIKSYNTNPIANIKSINTNA